MAGSAHSLHLICRRTISPLPDGVSIVRRPATYASESWEIIDEQAATLVGGWIYLHPAKSEASEFGGRILHIEHSGKHTAAGRPEIRIVFEASGDARGQPWRGAAHGMAWWSGPSYPTCPTSKASAFPRC